MNKRRKLSLSMSWDYYGAGAGGAFVVRSHGNQMDSIRIGSFIRCVIMLGLLCMSVPAPADTTSVGGAGGSGALSATGAHADATDRFGNTPLMMAVVSGDEAVVKRLIAAGANLNAKNVNGLSAVDYAATLGRTDILVALIAAGADVTDDSTALAWAVRLDSPACIKALIAAGDKCDAAMYLALASQPNPSWQELDTELIGTIRDVNASHGIVRITPETSGGDSASGDGGVDAGPVTVDIGAGSRIETRLGDRMSPDELCVGALVDVVGKSLEAGQPLTARFVTVIDRPSQVPASLIDLPWLTVYLLFVQCFDDDGSRGGSEQWSDIQDGLVQANRIYSKARIRFVSDPRTDFITVRSTAMNTNDDSDLQRLAAENPQKVVVVLRYGDGSRCSFAVGDPSYVILPHLSQYHGRGLGALCHELGHCFGLAHTFKMHFATFQEAASYLTAHGNDPLAFAGGGLTDTGTDPGIPFPPFRQVRQIEMNGVEIKIPWDNIMSYLQYEPRLLWMSDQQAMVVRRFACKRLNLRCDVPTDSNSNGTAAQTSGGPESF
jgi:hypothetical protein